MKTIISFVIGMIFFNLSRASDTTIFFRPISYSQVFEIAKKENKHVLLYFHFDGCGACVKMEKTAFKAPQVVDFYNNQFVSLDINTLKGEGLETNKIYNVKMHPTFLYLDSQGNILHKGVGVFAPDEFIAQGSRVLKEESTYASFVKQYKKGNREASFLFDLCYILRDAHELSTTQIAAYLKTQSLDDMHSEKNIRFIYEFARHNNNVAIPFGSMAYQFMYEHREKFMSYFDEDQISTRLVWIANLAAYKAIDELDEPTFNQALAVIKEFDKGRMFMYKEMDGRTTGAITEKNLSLRLQMDFERKKGDQNRYRYVSSQYIARIWDSANQLNELAWEYYQGKEDKEDLKEAISWVKRSIELENSYAANDTYAALLFKSGKLNKGHKQAEKAIAIAAENDEDYAETTALISKYKGQ